MMNEKQRGKEVQRFKGFRGSRVPRLNSPQYDLPDLRGKLRSFSSKNFTPVPSAGATGQAGQAGFKGSGVSRQAF